jgi:eukaryotic-like serine/threonine-protein kinase
MMNLASNPPLKEKPSLLFVDDEPSILMAVRVVFRTHYDVTVTTDGFEAIELLKTKKFHVIVSDQRMPNMTGVELLQQARDIAPDTIRILLTGYSDTDAILGAINEVEVHRFLQKPWDNSKLRQVIDESISLAISITNETAKENRNIDPNATPNMATSTLSAPVTISGGAERETVVVVDSKSALFTQTKAEMGDKVDVVHAATLTDVFQILEKTHANIMACSFDVQSEADRTFLQMLKQEHPYIAVIAMCDSTDSTRLIELINQAKIFRFLKKPVSMTLFSRYVTSAMKHAQDIRDNPILIRKQITEALPESVIKSVSAQLLRSHFARLNQSLASHFMKITAFFSRK